MYNSPLLKIKYMSNPNISPIVQVIFLGSKLLPNTIFLVKDFWNFSMSMPKFHPNSGHFFTNEKKIS